MTESASVSWGAIARASTEHGLVPPFRAAERQRLSANLEGAVALGPRAELRISGDWLRDAAAAGPAVSGAGDLRLGTVVRAARWTGPAGSLTLGLGWEAKMPNASDEGELGTDETDVLFGGWAEASRGALALQAGLGLGILGNPHRFANQDDVPLLRARATWRPGVVWIAPSVEADLATSRNPARVAIGGEAGVGRTWFASAGARAGLTPAAADWGVMVGLGWRGPLSSAPASE